MNRVPVQAMGAAAVLIGAALLVWRWQSVGFPPLMVLLGLLLLVGVPSALWLSLRSRPAAVPRRLPRVFWIGISLLALGFLDILLGVAGLSPGAAAPISIPMGSGRPQDSLRFAPLPKDATTEFRAVFPDLVVGRSLASTDGAYEVWLRRSGSCTFQLQAVGVKGRITVENQAMNTAYAAQPGNTLSASVIRGRVHLPWRAYGPVQFPGYVLYVSLPHDEAWAVSKRTLGVQGFSW